MGYKSASRKEALKFTSAATSNLPIPDNCNPIGIVAAIDRYILGDQYASILLLVHQYRRVPTAVVREEEWQRRWFSAATGAVPGGESEGTVMHQ